ncbi:nucleoside phosphorylase [Terriglobus roseus]|uniref:Adenosylhomocysteine nucleosidase n=1 Tax=Terriglobus roseus TaxID=392734 RepID=A0A1H4IVR4_9BACT|nr:nucleoside phosphorylase [Terriglobus roseus]SEB38159.1 adenosylhomocysteine nucleosidase [Terriglobus roseus]
MMNDAIVIIAAMPGELKPLVRSWAALETKDGVDGWQHPNGPIMAFAGGMGANAAMRSFARARQVCEPMQVLSVGWAGALREELAPGAIIRPSMVRDLNTGEMLPANGSGGLLLTSSRVAVREEKHRLAGTYAGSVAVDMEASTLARLAQANGLGFRALKAISDTLEEDLPDMNPFVTAAGRFATTRFIAHVATKPKYWSSLAQFGKQASLAAANLCAAIADDIGIERPK